MYDKFASIFDTLPDVYSAVRLMEVKASVLAIQHYEEIQHASNSFQLKTNRSHKCNGIFFLLVFHVKWKSLVSFSMWIVHTFAWRYCIWIWCTCTRFNWSYIICIHHRCVWGVKVRWWIYFWWNELRRLWCHLKKSQNNNWIWFQKYESLGCS